MKNGDEHVGRPGSPTNPYSNSGRVQDRGASNTANLIRGNYSPGHGHGRTTPYPKFEEEPPRVTGAAPFGAEAPGAAAAYLADSAVPEAKAAVQEWMKAAGSQGAYREAMERAQKGMEALAGKQGVVAVKGDIARAAGLGGLLNTLSKLRNREMGGEAPEGDPVQQALSQLRTAFEQSGMAAQAQQVWSK